MGVIYYDGTTIPPPETDSFNGGGQIYFKVSELKSHLIRNVLKYRALTPKPERYTPQPSFIHYHKNDILPL